MSEWRKVRADELCTHVVDCVNKTAPIVDYRTPYKMIRTTNVRSGWVDTDNVRYVDQATFTRWTRRLLPQRRDVILTREAPVGEVGILRTDEPVFLGQRLMLYRADPQKCDPRFLLYAMLGPDLQAELRRLGSGATVEHLRVPDCASVALSAPPLHVQKRIGDVLGALDDLIENDRQRLQLLKEMARALYREWLVYFRYPGHGGDALVESVLGRIPEGWEPITCGQALTALGGGTPSKAVPEFWQGGTIPWFTPSDLTQNLTRYTVQPEFRITELGLARSSARLFPAGSVLMTSRATLGVLAIATTSGSANQGFIVIPPDERWPPVFVYEWLADHAEEMAAVATGATFKEITKGAFKRLPFLLPPQRVLDSYRNAASPIEATIERLERQVVDLTAIRDLLLPRLVTGQIDVSGLDLDALIEAGVA